MGSPSPRYTAEFKQKAVEPCGKSGRTYAGVARGLGCDVGSLSDWARKADWICNGWLNNSYRDNPAFPNSTGLMQPSVERILKLLRQCT